MAKRHESQGEVCQSVTCQDAQLHFRKVSKVGSKPNSLEELVFIKMLLDNIQCSESFGILCQTVKKSEFTGLTLEKFTNLEENLVFIVPKHLKRISKVGLQVEVKLTQFLLYKNIFLSTSLCAFRLVLLFTMVEMS